MQYENLEEGALVNRRQMVTVKNEAKLDPIKNIHKINNKLNII
ncbi:hypothetical protein [Atopobacter phocae]|nr:hypothetical protein [Atopobacter phocae]